MNFLVEVGWYRVHFLLNSLGWFGVLGVWMKSLRSYIGCSGTEIGAVYQSTILKTVPFFCCTELVS